MRTPDAARATPNKIAQWARTTEVLELGAARWLWWWRRWLGLAASWWDKHVRVCDAENLNTGVHACAAGGSC